MAQKNNIFTFMLTLNSPFDLTREYLLYVFLTLAAALSRFADS